MNSKLFVGQIEHSRHLPRDHHFQYPLYVYGVELGELAQLDQSLPLFGYNRFRPAAIHDSDYLTQGPQTLDHKVRCLLLAHGIDTQIDHIYLVTSARYFNYVFNPVSFFYCFDAQGNLVCILTEVNNTFGERHVYVLDALKRKDNGSYASYQTPKRFHVSPFNNLEGVYHFSFADVRHTLDIQIRLIRDEGEVFRARLSGRAQGLTAWRHARTLLSKPLVPHMSIPRIYRQALKLRVNKQLSYHPKPTPQSRMTIGQSKASLLQSWARRLTLNMLAKMRQGGLTLTLPDGQSKHFGDVADVDPVKLEIRDNRFFARIVAGGDVGLGESYVAGEWDTPDLVKLFETFIANRQALGEGHLVTTWWSRLKEFCAHYGRRNTLGNSRQNIPAHYDLGNDFYSLFLDRSMLYSCARFNAPDEPLHMAQMRKADDLISKAQLGPDDHLLEIGCGWGGFALRAAQQTGCQVTGITLSPAQQQFARERVASAGLSERIKIELVDYRRLQGQYDKIVSIEMLEAVGHQYFGAYFGAIDRLLKPSGIAVIQSITLPDSYYPRYLRSRDWIQKHIFPGGHLPSLTALTSAMSGHSKLMVENLENIGPHYALTLRQWRRRFDAQTAKLDSLGYDAAFRRKWRYYLSICEAGFAQRALNDIQLVLTRPTNITIKAF